MNTISAIIPTYNREGTILRALESILNQTHSCHEIIIIDDGSTDETESLLEPYIDKDQIIYKKTKNQGVSAARNVGIEMATGEWVSFLDSDDEWLPDKNRKQLESQKETSCSLIHGEEIWIRNGKRVNPKLKHKKSGGMIFEKCLPLCLISPSATMIKRSLLRELNSFDTDFIVCEDYDLWLRYTLKFPVAFVESPIIKKYGGHEDQLSTKYKAMDYYRIKSMFQILQNEELSRPLQGLVKKEITLKGTILLKGYKKHQNMMDYNEVFTWVSLAR
jgi:glycosyltransferase involved in cell wall biosynthesis